MNLPLWLRVTLRFVVCAVVTLALLRWLGVQLPGFILIGLAWAYILGIPAVRWFAGLLAGGLYAPADDQFRVRPEFSIAEGHAAVGRYREAVEQFRRDIERYPKEVTPHVRIAEIQFDRTGEIDAGIAELEAALGKATGEDAFVLVAHRLADAHLQHRHDKAAAVAYLDEILRRYPHSKHALGARHRIQQLTER